MAYWLLKSEPAKYSWEQLVKDGRTHWNGVRNFQAANNLKAMRLRDLAFFYHSVEGPALVGICQIVREYFPDPGHPLGRFAIAHAHPHRTFPQPPPPPP